MPVFSIPTVGRLISRARSDVEAALSNGAAWLRKTVEWGLAPVWAGLAYGLYGRLPVLANDIVPGPQNTEEALLHHGSLWLGEGYKPTAPATLPISGTGTAGTIAPAGTRWQRADGAIYESQQDFELGTDDFEVQSIALSTEPGYGADGNTEVGAELTLVSIVPGLDATWVVDGTPGDTVGGGADQETKEAYADRVTQRGANPPRGGTIADYEAWALEVSGIGRAWAYKGVEGAGVVTVFVARDDLDNPVPDAVLVQNVQDYLDEEKTPAGATVNVYPIALYIVPVEAAIKPNTAATRDACDAALRAMFNSRSFAGTGLGDYFPRSWITEALSNAIGEEDHELTSPAADLPISVGRLPVLGTTTYSTKA